MWKTWRSALCDPQEHQLSLYFRELFLRHLTPPSVAMKNSDTIFVLKREQLDLLPFLYGLISLFLSVGKFAVSLGAAFHPVQHSFFGLPARRIVQLAKLPYGIVVKLGSSYDLNKIVLKYIRMKDTS